MHGQASVIIPAYNESSTVAAVVKAAFQVPQVGEVIVVSDGSTDSTAKEARAAGARVLGLPVNKGKGGAIVAGMASARFEYLLFLDADLIGLTSRHVAILLSPLLEGEADMVVGVFASGKKSTDLAQRIAPYLSGQRALRRSAFSGLRLEDAGYGLEVALSRWASQKNLAVKRVPLANLTHLVKERKRGFIRGMFARQQMYKELILAAISNSSGSVGRWKGRKLPSNWRMMLMVVSLFLLAATYDVMFHQANAEIAQMQGLPDSVLGPRIMVVSPHPDDETLGSGGLIEQAVANGSQVRVVFMTNGDGFRRGIKDQFSLTLPKSEDYIRYGELRQREAISALKTLGVTPSQTVFLGYPDGGLATMWRYSWDDEHPYTSLYTKCTVSPYANSYEPGALYTAPTVLDNLEKIMSEFKPTDIYIPHPEDSHPDHWATHAFVTAAVTVLGQKENVFHPELFDYIIHRGAWQVMPVMFRAKPLVPPSDLWGGDTVWHSYFLNPSTLKNKKKAIDEYHSQLRMMGEFLLNFARPNELFGSLAEKVLPSSRQVKDSADRWQGIAPLVKDPKGDTVGRRVEHRGDLKSLYLLKEPDGLRLKMETWNNISGSVSYWLALYVLPADGGKIQRWVLTAKPGTKPEFQWSTRADGVTDESLSGSVGENYLEVNLPVNLTSDGSKLMLGSESRFDGIILDTMPWWVINVSQGEVGKGTGEDGSNYSK